MRKLNVKSVSDVRQLLHACPDWDGLIVDALDEEGEGSCCTCDRELLNDPKTIENLQSSYYHMRSETYEEHLIPKLTEEEQGVFEKLDKSISWPFPITNGERNPESQKLLDKPIELVRIKPDLSNEDIALL